METKLAPSQFTIEKIIKEVDAESIKDSSSLLESKSGSSQDVTFFYDDLGDIFYENPPHNHRSLNIKYSSNLQIKSVNFLIGSWSDEDETLNDGLSVPQIIVMTRIARYNLNKFKKGEKSYLPEPMLVDKRKTIGNLDPEKNFWKAFISVLSSQY